MSSLEQRVAAAQRRLWANRFLAQFTSALAIAALVFAAVVLLDRLFDLHGPVFWIGVFLAAASVLAAAVWTLLTREDGLTAAARLDEAAGLRERLSTSQFCASGEDEFARAVVADAQRAAQGLRVSRLIPWAVPPRLGWTVGAIVTAALAFLVTPGLLKPKAAVAREDRDAAVEATRVAVKHQMDELRELAARTPGLEELKPENDDLDRGAVARDTPADIRHEALKKIDRYEDAVRQKRGSDRYDSMQEMRRMMRAVKPPTSQDAPTQKLGKALQEGDFKTAQEEIEKLREHLATLKSDEDQEMVKQLGQQLEELAKQIENAASKEKLVEKLEQAGIKKEDAERMLERLSKKDLDQLQKRLEESGMSRDQAEKLAKQLQQKQGGQSMASKLGKAMKDSAAAAQAGQAENAAEGLSQAGQQLSDLEQLEQEMAQLDAAANALADAKKDIEQRCPS